MLLQNAKTNRGYWCLLPHKVDNLTLLLPMSKTRKDRSDIQVGNLEKKHSLPSGTVRNTDHTDARLDKELGRLQREYGEEAMEPMLEPEAKPVEADQTNASP